MVENQTVITSKKIAITFTIPNFGVFLATTRKYISTLFADVYNPMSQSFTNIGSGASERAKRMKFPRMRRVGFNKRFLKLIIPIILVVIVVGALFSLVKFLPDAQSKPVSPNQPVTVADTLATVELNKKFTFPLNDDKGVKVGDFDYVIQSAAIQKQIIVQGQRATAVPGRVFLILNLKITNNLKKTIQLNTRDYIRLTVASDRNEQLAPDIHNDPVEVQAISTKFTRVGVAINEADAKKAIELKIGEIDGAKQTINLNFKF